MSIDQKVKDELDRRKELFNMAQWKCCLNCEFFEHKGAFAGFCTKAQTQPPLTVIVIGCELWKDDIPF